MSSAKPDGNSLQESAPTYETKAPLPPVWFTVIPGIVLILIVYVWFASVGTWTKWPQPYTYYDQLATAFRLGHLYIEQQPSPELLALKNPYDPAIRKDVPFVTDASLYKGRYYFYFGPVPALLVLIAKSLIPGVIGDQYLVFTFTLGVLLVETLFVLKIRRRFFPRISAWMVAPCILLLGLTSPFSWILGNPATVHDAAICAGQLFFLTGVFMAFSAFDGEALSRSKAILAGAFWALALGSRITLVVPIAFMVFYILAGAIRKPGHTSPRARLFEAALYFGVPLLFGIVGLGWSNWARFGSVFETGISYQLAMLYIQGPGQQVFSLRYLIQNLYNYLLMPPKVRYNFPYLWPLMGIRRPILAGIQLPSLYFAEQITGIVYMTPFLLFAIPPALGLRGEGASQLGDETDRNLLRWLTTALGGSFLCGFGVFAIFFWASERYLMDFVPPLLVLSVMGFWQLSEKLRNQRVGRAGLVLVGAALLAVSLVVSNLLAIGLNAQGFRSLNPVLWQQLNNVFRP